VIKGKSLRISSIAKEIRLGELNHVLYRLLNNYMIESMCVLLNLYYWIENAEFWKFSRNRLAGCS